MGTGEDYISMSANSGLSNLKQLAKYRHFTKYFAPDARFRVVGEITC